LIFWSNFRASKTCTDFQSQATLEELQEFCVAINIPEGSQDIFARVRSMEAEFPRLFKGQRQQTSKQIESFWIGRWIVSPRFNLSVQTSRNLLIHWRAYFFFKDVRPFCLVVNISALHNLSISGTNAFNKTVEQSTVLDA